ncbi:MAG: zinc ribbon domain-containing protein [Telmatospirillum sp.]|nr:zinc ribbon domain-containing protein [Telmatospirillum sp.]
MSKSLRLSEKWFRRGLWLVSLVFAGFLTGLGGTVVDDLPRVEHRLDLSDFMDATAARGFRDALSKAHAARDEASALSDQASLRHDKALADSQAARETFDNWLATRRATARADQDAELVERTANLDRLKKIERDALAKIEEQKQAELDAEQAAAKAQAGLNRLEADAQDKLEEAYRAQELRVFLYRLALTLPLLLIAGWLFAKKRHSVWWPFVWGFIFFSLEAFFVELVPYLPSYGGYVRYIVGIVVTVVIGRQAIVGLNRYLERQKQVEQMPDAKRREGLDYDVALARLAKGVCPGCERPVPLKEDGLDFCPHCGISLHVQCDACHTRRSAFARFCHACGAQAPQAVKTDGVPDHSLPPGV